MKKDGKQQIFGQDLEPAQPRQEGWILLAVQFRDANGMTGLFRVEYSGAYRPPHVGDMNKALTGEEYGDFSFSFFGEKLDPKTGEWIEPCYVQIPQDAYLMASWQYYAADNPKWESPHISTPAESQI